MTHSRQARYTSQVLIGTVLLILGTLLLFDNLELISVGPVWKHWPLFVVAIGLGKLVQAETVEDRGSAIWWLFIGAWLYISVFRVFGFGFRDSWPLLLVGWGVSMVWKSFLPKRNGIVKENSYG